MLELLILGAVCLIAFPSKAGTATVALGETVIKTALTDLEVDTVNAAILAAKSKYTGGRDAVSKVVDSMLTWCASRIGFLGPLPEKSLVMAHIAAESSFIPSASKREMNKEGDVWSVSLGLAQILWPPTARTLAPKVLLSDSDPATVINPANNVRLAIGYMMILAKKYPVLKDRISAYNAGKPLIRKEGGYVNQAYVDRVYNEHIKNGGKAS